MTETGAYTQHSNGVLDISIGGTTAGTKYDQLNPTTSSLNGTLNVGLINGYVPTIGTTFKILNFTSATGTFTTVNGLAINGTEHFTISYQGTDVLLTVVSGALHQPASNSVLHLPGLVAKNVDSDLSSVATKPGLSATQLRLTGTGNTSFSNSVFQAVTTRQQTSSGLLQPRPTTTFTLAAAPSGNAPHAATSRLRFPTRFAASNARSTHANNGAYGLHNRAVGGGFAFPLSHLSKPQMGFTLE